MQTKNKALLDYIEPEDLQYIFSDVMFDILDKNTYLVASKRDDFTNQFEDEENIKITFFYD